MSGWLSAPAERTAALITARNIGGVVDSLEIGVCVFADHDRAVADAPFWLRSADGHTALATGDLVASSSSPASLPVGERSSRRVSIEGANGFGDDGSRNAAVGCAVVCSARFVGCAVDGCDEVVVRDDHVFTREFRTALDGATLPEVDHPTVSLTSSWSAPQRRSEVHVNRMLRSPEPFRDPAILRTVLAHKALGNRTVGALEAPYRSPIINQALKQSGIARRNSSKQHLSSVSTMTGARRRSQVNLTAPVRPVTRGWTSSAASPRAKMSAASTLSSSATSPNDQRRRSSMTIRGLKYAGDSTHRP